MKNRLNNYVLLILLLGAYTCISCKKETTSVEDTLPTHQNISTQEEDYEDGEEYTEELSPTEEYTFPKTGKTPKDFIPKGTAYKIQYQTKGDLNGDGLEDVVLVLTNISDKDDARPMLILKQNQDKSYTLDKVSKRAMPDEFLGDGYKHYYSEYITIDNAHIEVDLSTPNFNGSINYKYAYKEEGLVLIEAGQFNRGAGANSSYTINFITGNIDYYFTNQLEDPEEHTKTSLTMPVATHTFEETYVESLINKIYDQYISDRVLLKL